MTPRERINMKRAAIVKDAERLTDSLIALDSDERPATVRRLIGQHVAFSLAVADLAGDVAALFDDDAR